MYQCIISTNRYWRYLKIGEPVHFYIVKLRNCQIYESRITFLRLVFLF